MRCRKLARSLLLGAAVLFAAATARAEYFTTESWRTDITVARDSSFTVRESIEVTFTSPRHGIYRDIPFRYLDELGREVRTPLEILAVTDAGGQPREYKVLRQKNDLRVRVGDPDAFMDGRQVFVIVYRVENAVLFLEDHDELYWNAVGAAWPTAIGDASARVRLDGGGAGDLKAACYRGAYGSKEAGCAPQIVAGGADFSAGRALGPGEAFTVVLGWPKGLVSPPGALKRLLWALNPAEHWVFLIPLVSLALMSRAWWRKGRDPDVGETVTVMFTPPEEKGRWLAPAELGLLADGRLDRRDITASMVNLAVKGLLTIEEVRTDGLVFDKTDWRLRKVKDAGEELPAFERKLLGDVFPSSGEVLVSQLTNSFHAKLAGLRKTAVAALKEMGYYSGDPTAVKGAYIGLGLAVLVFGLFAGAFLPGWIQSMSPGKSMLAAVLAALPPLAFAPVMPARTRKGALAHLKVRGFEEFLDRAERDRLERMADKNLFEKYLPYAIALDVSDRWAKAFEGIYQEPPKWYVSPMTGPAAFRPSAFSHSLGAALSTMGTAMYSAPRSSGGGGGGFGGGGSSGGGFGGGGGGSW